MAKEFVPSKAILGEIEKSPDNKIVVSIDDFGGDKDYLNVREHWKPEDQENYIPTKKGFTLPTEDFTAIDELIIALEKAKEWLTENADTVKRGKPPAEDAS